MFPLNKETARKSIPLLNADTQEALMLLLSHIEEQYVRQINADSSADTLKVLASKIDLLRNLKKFEQVIRQNAY